MSKFELSAEQEYPRSRAIRGLRDLIGRRYGSGDWLPAEHELCEQFSVSRGTLRTAIKQLEREGLLRAQAGRGRMVTPVASGRPKTVMGDTIAIVTHETSSFGSPRQTGTDLFIQMSAIESIGRAGMNALMVRPDRSSTDRLRGSDVLRGLLAERPRGVVLLRRAVESHPAREVIAEFKEAGIPIVMYGDLPELSEFDSVVSDHLAGSYMLTKWLLARGCRRILRLWQLSVGSPLKTRPPEWLIQRDLGHERAMSEANIKPLPAAIFPDIVARDYTEENFKAFMHLSAGQLMPYLSAPQPIDAIMATSDGALTPVAAACRLFGKTPNRDVTIVGYDNFWPDDNRRRWEPTIPAATIDKRNQLIGEQLIDLLFARVNGKLPAAAQHRLVEPQLLIPSDSSD